jgi:hypothetical protein
MEMHPVTADDGNGNLFYGLTKHPNPDGEDHVGVWVFIDGDNGWGKNNGEVALLHLKKAGNGHFVS